MIDMCRYLKVGQVIIFVLQCYASEASRKKNEKLIVASEARRKCERPIQR